MEGGVDVFADGGLPDGWEFGEVLEGEEEVWGYEAEGEAARHGYRLRLFLDDGRRNVGDYLKSTLSSPLSRQSFTIPRAT